MKQHIINKVKVAGGALASLLLFASCFLASCVNDDGSYDYTELAEITIEGIPELTEVLGHVENIKLSPRFISSVDGEIKPGDSNYTVQYRIGHKGMGSMAVDSVAQKALAWLDITPKSGFDIDYPADFSTGAYLLWVTITDNRNGAVTSKQYQINVGSTTYEGWLVLCNEGAEERVRLDMISKISSTKTVVAKDLAQGLPTLHHATSVLLFTKDANPGDEAYLFTREGSYDLDTESLESNPEWDFNSMHFAFDPGETIIKQENFAGPYYDWTTRYMVCFGENGNAYAYTSGTYGAAFSTPINTTTEGTGAQFRVAPYCGYSWMRPWNRSYGEYMLFYDIDNRRFLIFDGTLDRLQLNVIPDPGHDEVNLFSYTTGKDFVYMQSTRRSNGLVYTILQDPATGKRSIYGINLGGATYAQELYIPDVDAPGFDQATQFAFDTRFPLLFYSVGSKLYCYNLGTRVTKEMNTGLGNGEEITKLKFNIYLIPNYNKLANQSEEFMNQQYRLIVCTCDGNTTSGGKVTFFDVDGVNSTVTKGEQYTGFGKIVDILYRERSI